MTHAMSARVPDTTLPLHAAGSKSSVSASVPETGASSSPDGYSPGSSRAPDLRPSRPSVGSGRRILLVAPQPFFSLRGTPMNVRQMAGVLGRAGYEVHLATFAPGEHVSIPGVRHHRALHIPGLHEVPIGFSRTKVLHDAASAAS